jgi:DNA modification methylase
MTTTYPSVKEQGMYVVVNEDLFLLIHAHVLPNETKTTEAVYSHCITDRHLNKIITGDCQVVMAELPANSIHLVITSPPYFGCQKYGEETLGREADPREYVRNIVTITDSIKRVLRPYGSFFLNVGDVYFGTKGFHRNLGRFYRKTQDHYTEHRIVAPDGKYLQHKQLLLLPPRIAMAMQEGGWILRNVIIWEKTNPQPSPARDRRLPCYEYIFHFVKSRRYYFDQPLCRALGHHRDVIRTSVSPFDGHPASFSERLMEPFILTSSKPGDIVLDPFSGSGCIAAIAKRLGRNFVGIELNEAYAKDSRDRIERVEPGEGYCNLVKRNNRATQP